MYLKFRGIQTDKDLQTYPSVHLTSPQEWDPFVLDYLNPKDNGEPNSTYDSIGKFQFDPTFDEFDDYINNYFQLHPKFHQLITYWLINIQFNGRVTVDFLAMRRHLKSWNP